MSTDFTNAVVVDQARSPRLTIQRVPLAAALPGDVTIKVRAISLNRGETRRALTSSPTGARPGWDFAGVVEDTGGLPDAPPVGSRVVGLLQPGAWAELVRAPLNAIAVIPNGVSDAQAATLPVAGLTALFALRKGGLLLGRKVLVDGASGGVGQLAIQLAAASGAEVFSHVRREESRAGVQAWSTGGVIVGPTLEAARSMGPYDLIVDSIGGAALGSAMSMLRPDGTCVTFGATASEGISTSGRALLDAPGAIVRSLLVFRELGPDNTAADGLALLLRLVDKGTLTPHIGIEAPWTEIGTAAQQLMDRQFEGKAVLHLPA